MAITDLKPYFSRTFPVIKGGDKAFLADELKKISTSIGLLIQELVALEARVVALEP